MRKLLWPLVAIAIVSVACGGGKGESAGGGGNTPIPTSPNPTESESTAPECTPDGTELKIEAQNIAFDKDCLAAPADTAFTIEFDNQDAGVPHNVAISATDGTPEFKGELVTGVEDTTYDVDALAAGTYEFHCDVHPSQMQGTFVVA